MKEQTTGWHHRWMHLATTIDKRLNETGLRGLADAFKVAFKPLAPVAAELLWLVQPVFAVFGEATAINTLTDLLFEPDGSPPRVLKQSEPPESR